MPKRRRSPSSPPIVVLSPLVSFETAYNEISHGFDTLKFAATKSSYGVMQEAHTRFLDAAKKHDPQFYNYHGLPRELLPGVFTPDLVQRIKEAALDDILDELPSFRVNLESVGAALIRINEKIEFRRKQRKKLQEELAQ
jgi:hypothetical protein